VTATAAWNARGDLILLRFHLDAWQRSPTIARLGTTRAPASPGRHPPA